MTLQQFSESDIKRAIKDIASTKRLSVDIAFGVITVKRASREFGEFEIVGDFVKAKRYRGLGMQAKQFRTVSHAIDWIVNS